MHVGAEAGRVGGREALGELASDDAGEHVAGARRGGPGCRSAPRRPVLDGSATMVAALEQHGHAAAPGGGPGGPRPGVAATWSAERADQAGELTLVRRDHRRGRTVRQQLRSCRPGRTGRRRRSARGVVVSTPSTSRRPAAPSSAAAQPGAERDGLELGRCLEQARSGGKPEPAVASRPVRGDDLRVRLGADAHPRREELRAPAQLRRGAPPGRHGRRPAHAVDPPTTSTVPTERLWSGLGLRDARARPIGLQSVSSQTSGSVVTGRGMPIGTITTSPESAPPGAHEVPHLGGVQRDGEVGLHGGPGDSSRWWRRRRARCRG